MKRSMQANIRIVEKNSHRDINLSSFRFKKADVHKK